MNCLPLYFVEIYQISGKDKSITLSSNMSCQGYAKKHIAPATAKLIIFIDIIDNNIQYNKYDFS